MQRLKTTAAIPVLATLAAVAVLSQSAHAVGTLAGTKISNQARIDYSDTNDVAQPTVTSNVVTTTVAAVYGVDVATANSPQNTLANSEVYYPVTVTNTGNKAEDFTLAAAQENLPWTREIYVDTNGNGVLDPGEPLAGGSTGIIDPDDSKKFILKVVVPSGAANGTSEDTTVTATSKNDPVAPKATDSATVTTNVTDAAVLTASKSGTPDTVDPLSANAADRTVAYTVTVTNTGASNATNVVIEDPLPTSPAGVRLTGAATSNPAGTLEYWNGTAWVAFNAADIATYTKVRVTLASVANGSSAELRFNVEVPQGSSPGTMLNTASAVADGLTQVPTNTVSTTIEQTAAVSVTAAPGQSTYAGGTVTYNHTATNDGNGTDTFNLIPATVPAGWTVQIFYADGVTPVADTNGDGIPDTGDLPAGGTFDFVVAITAPNNATPAAYDVIGTVRSVHDPAVSTTTTDTTTILADPVVTLTKNVSSTTPKPGEVIAYTINYSVANAPAKVTVAQDAIPAGTTLVAGSITNGGVENGGVITWNLGTLPAGTTGQLAFQVKVDPNATADTKINNTVSATYQNPAGTPQTPVTADAPEATVQSAAGVTLTPDNAGNATPGSSQVYGHVLANTGNATDSFNIAVTSPNGWPYSVFIDNGTTPGVLDAGDTGVTGPLTLASGASENLLVRVQVPAGTATGTVDKAQIKATSVADGTITASAFDTTTVVAPNAPVIDATKTVAVDTAAGTYTGPDGRTYNNTDGVARPGATLVYTLNYSNLGTGDAKNVVLKDAIPANTTLVAGSITGGGVYDAGTNTITWTIGNVASGANGTVSFKVTIN